MIIRYNNCPLCGSRDFSDAGMITDYSVSKEIFPVLHCNDCTLNFTQNIPDPGSIDKYYQSEDYISHTDTRKGFINSMYHRVRSHTLRSKRKTIVKLAGKDKGLLLDYGSGTGAFLNEMKTNGWEVTGLEPDPGAREKARELYGLEIKTPENLFQLPEAGFDVITLWHVLEHVHQLQETVAALQRALRPGGIILIAVPNYKSKDADIYKQFWAAWDIPRHLYHFSPKSIEVLLTKHGFAMKDMLPMWFDSFYVSMLSEKYKRGKDNIPMAVINGLRSNFNALFKKGSCSSQIYVASKR